MILHPIGLKIFIDQKSNIGLLTLCLIDLTAIDRKVIDPESYLSNGIDPTAIDPTSIDLLKIPAMTPRILKVLLYKTIQSLVKEGVKLVS